MKSRFDQLATASSSTLLLPVGPIHDDIVIQHDRPRVKNLLNL